LAPVIEFSDEERIKIIEEQERERLESQAKATWEARQKEVDEAEQRGIRKMVEWIKNQRVLKSKDKSMIVIEFQTEEWQAFLKECKFDK
jgi:acetamidase/formamidase